MEKQFLFAALLGACNHLHNRQRDTVVGMLFRQRIALAAWMESNVSKSLNVFAFPQPNLRLLRKTNGVERVNKEIRRRIRVASLFPDEVSSLRLVSAALTEISDAWQTTGRGGTQR